MITEQPPESNEIKIMETSYDESLSKQTPPTSTSTTSTSCEEEEEEEGRREEGVMSTSLHTLPSASSTLMMNDHSNCHNSMVIEKDTHKNDTTCITAATASSSESAPQTPQNSKSLLNNAASTADDDDDVQLHPPQQQGQHTMSKCSSSNSGKSVMKRKLQRMKVTILNLTGIKVSSIENGSSSSHRRHHHRHHHHQRHQYRYPKKDHPKATKQESTLKDQLQQNILNNNNMHKFAITASVSFTGSCDPSDMRIVSSGFCSLSQRLVVESLPVVVPNGMTDSLIAIWDDSPTSTTFCAGGGEMEGGKYSKDRTSTKEYLSQGSLSFSGSSGKKTNTNNSHCVIGKEKGKIQLSDESQSSTLPHLFVSMIQIGECPEESIDVDFDHVHDRKEQLNDNGCHLHDCNPELPSNNDSPISPQDKEQARIQVQQSLDKSCSDMATVDSEYMKSKRPLQQQHSMTLSALSLSVHNSIGPDLDETDVSSSENLTPAIIRSRENAFSIGDSAAFDGSGSNATLLRSSTLSPFQSLTNIREETGTSSTYPGDEFMSQSTKPLRASTIAPPPFHTPTRTSLRQKSLPEESPLILPLQNQDRKETPKRRGTPKCPPIQEVYEANAKGYNVQDPLPYKPIINTPSQTSIETSVPEILEFNIALRIQQIPSNTGTTDSFSYLNQEGLLNNIQSLCSPDANGGGAVAHLVLFPDVLSSKEELSNGSTGRILELPVRRKNVPFYRSSVSSVSGLTIHSNSYYDYRRHEPDIVVDIEEDAMLRIKIEECSDEDIDALDNEQKLVTKSLSGEVDMSLIDDMNEEEINGEEEKNDLSQKENSAPEKDVKCAQSSQDPDSASHEPQADSSAEKDTEGETPKGSTNDDDDDIAKSKQPLPHNERNSQKTPQQDPDIDNTRGGLCNPFRIENIVNIFSGIVANCSDDVDLYGNIQNAVSMDSTIHTMDYQR